MNSAGDSDPPPIGPDAASKGALATGVVSKDGKWFWDGSRWSATRATIVGSTVPRILAWTLLGALPLGALVSLPVGSLLSKINSGVTAIAVTIVFVVCEALVVYLVLRRTPRITVERGTVTIGRLFNDERRSVPALSINSVELVRGSKATLVLTEGYAGEGRVLLHLAHGSSIELGWDAFAGRAATLAWQLGVTLIDPAAEASRQRAAAAMVRDPGREKRKQILINITVVGVVVAVVVLLFGPLAMSIFQMISHR